MMEIAHTPNYAYCHLRSIGCIVVVRKKLGRDKEVFGLNDYPIEQMASKLKNNNI